MFNAINQAIAGRFAEFTAFLSERKEQVHPRTEPSDEPLQWIADDRKLVRLDHAVLACHLLAARVTTRSLAGIHRQKLVSITTKVLDFITGQVAIRIGGRVPLGPLRVIREVEDLIDANELQTDLELSIRRQSIRVQRDLREQILFKRSHRTRKTRNVFTRNPGPSQRRPNKGWTNPPAK